MKQTNILNVKLRNLLYTHAQFEPATGLQLCQKPETPRKAVTCWNGTGLNWISSRHDG